MTVEDSPEQLKADMASDPAVRPILNQQVFDQAQEFLILAMTFARKWTRLEDPWEGHRILVDAVVWMQEANKKVDEETIRQRRRGERYKKGGVLL